MTESSNTPTPNEKLEDQGAIQDLPLPDAAASDVKGGGGYPIEGALPIERLAATNSSTLSSMMKKMSDASAAIISNMK
jgi:hypothetical protein